MTPWITPFGNSGPAHHAAPVHRTCYFSQAITPKAVTCFSDFLNAYSRTFVWHSEIREAGHWGGPLRFSGHRPKWGEFVPLLAGGFQSFQ
jgi:hypothetical protein